MDQINVILAPLSGRTVCTTKTVYQYNQGMVLKLLGIDLPQAYTVDYANSVSGSSISQVGGADGATIPDQFFVPGSTIHAWVVLSGTGYAVTRYHIMIPISPRAVRTNEEPTPSQQSALDEAISALNQAVDAAETAITHYPTVIDGYWCVWDVVAGEYVSTGVSAEGTQGPTGPAGADGKDGKDGEPGRDGTDGQDGTDGTSSYVWIRYASAQPTQDSDMKTTPDAWMGIYSGDSATAPTVYTAYTWYNIKGQTGPVTDVQVNGTSVLSDGVANVPLASGSSFGVAKVDSALGITINSGGKLSVQGPNDAQIKAGTVATRPITPYHQHASTFYGLAKAAGDTTQSSSSNAVGTYTDSAKSAISQMLNAPITVSGTTPTITALPGVRYVCGEVATLDITLPASGCVDVVFESGSTPTVLTITPPTGVTVKWANGFDPTALEANTTYEINIADGLGVAGEWA